MGFGHLAIFLSATMISTRIRLKPQNDYSPLYQGKEYLCPLTMQNMTVLEDAALWYLEYSDNSQYFGVLDFDIAREPNSTDTEYLAKKEEVLEIIISEITKRFYFYQIYDSGNKGFHVYVFDISCWLKPSAALNRQLWIRAQLQKLFGETLFDMLDLSNHYIGKGIRPYTCAHPTTGRMPKLIKKSHNCPDNFWEWFMDLRDTPTEVDDIPIAECETPPLFVSSPQILRVNNPTNSLDANLQQLYNNIAGFQHKGGNLYTITGTKHCCFINADHKTQKNYIYKYPPHHAQITCHSGKCNNATKYVTSKTTPLTDIEPLLTKLNIQPRNRKILPAEVPYILKNDVEWCLQPPGFGAIFAPMGSGKTKALEDWLEDQPATFSYLLIVVRISQAKYFSHRYKNLVDYQKVKGSLHGIPKLACCMNSVSRLLAPDGSLPYYDLLILDEIESVVGGSISKILSSGRTEQCSIWNILGTLIKSCGKTLIMDGIPTVHSFNYFTGLGIMQDFSILEHHRQPDFRIYKCFCHQQEFLDQMKTDLANGKNVVLVTNTKEIQTLVFNQIDCDSKIMINADSETKIKNTSKKPNEKWNVRFLAYNTAVGAGASFDLNHFHIMYAVISTNSCIPQDFYQLICRIRKLQDSKVMVLIMDCESGPIPTIEEFKISKIQNITNFHGIQSNYRSRLSVLQVVPPTIVQNSNLVRVNINPSIREAANNPNSIFNLLQAGVIPGPVYPPQPHPIATITTPHLNPVVPVNNADRQIQQRLTECTTVENYKLDICDMDYKVVRLLSAHKYLKLKHEDDFFLNTLVEFEYEKLCLRNSEEYSKNFFKMIRRNGGIVIEIKEHQKEVLKTSSRMIKKDARKMTDEKGVETKNAFWDPGPDFNPARAKIWNNLVHFNDISTQYRWLALRNRLIQDPLEVYSKEFSVVNTKNRAINNTLLFSGDILNAFDVLARLCPFTIDKITGKITGVVPIVKFYENYRKFQRAIEDVYKQVYNETQIRYTFIEPSDATKPSNVNVCIWKNLKRMFKIFGINCNYQSSSGGRVRVNGTRLVNSSFEFCEETQNIRLALANIEFDTGEKNGNAIDYLVEKQYSK